MIELECYHGTTLEFAQSILKQGFLPSRDNDSLRLGEGAYFFGCGNDPNYALDCAIELERFQHKKGKHTGKSAILKCCVSCPEEAFFDMCDFERLEMFHKLRYKVHEAHVKSDPEFEFPSAAAADTETMNLIRNRGNFSVVRCLQFFGMFSREDRISIHKRKYPKTFVPNVLIICANTEQATISNIEIVREEVFDDEYPSTI